MIDARAPAGRDQRRRCRTLDELVGARGLRWRSGLPEMDDGRRAIIRQLDTDQIKASTIASAIEINRPVNLKKCLRALDFCDGVVRGHRSGDHGCQGPGRCGRPGLRAGQCRQRRRGQAVREEGVIAPSDRVVCILTGHQLKDPTATVAYHGTDQDNFDKVLGSRGVHRAGFANRPVIVANDLDDIIRTIALYSETEPQHPARFDQTDRGIILIPSTAWSRVGIPSENRAMTAGPTWPCQSAGHACQTEFYTCRMSDGTSSLAEGAMLPRSSAYACGTEWSDADVSCPACGFQHPPLIAAEDLIASWVVNSPIPPESSSAAQDAVLPRLRVRRANDPVSGT